MSKFKVGDIVLVDLGDASHEHTIAGVRPGILVHEEGNIMLIVPLTTNQKRLHFNGTYLLEPDAMNHLNHRSVALVFQIQAFDSRRALSRIGSLAPKDKRALNTLLRKTITMA